MSVGDPKARVQVWGTLPTAPVLLFFIFSRLHQQNAPVADCASAIGLDVVTVPWYTRACQSINGTSKSEEIRKFIANRSRPA